jgi:hypothetical protein
VAGEAPGREVRQMIDMTRVTDLASTLLGDDA